ncbi:hypothetical protein TRAPUB_1000 [Trametes pubescens]|uniref:F-box domain-containing protein n=1 Tax=Trametes pubescens TaxID=154538 RepID=A0A1M2VKD6_TRAPU|nr:hypothetical protein TRAPUB_1000 [Trametes pubescens]
MSATPIQSRNSRDLTPVDAARTQLLEEISYHSQETLRLKTLLNSRRAISRLPPELLLHIFLLQAEAFQQENLLRWPAAEYCNRKPPEHKPLYTWTNVALVCRGWRELALQSTQLWACLVLDERVPATWVRTILARAERVPLTVVMHAVSHTHCSGCVSNNHPEQNYRYAVELLAEVLPATRRLAVFIGKSDYADVCNALCGPAPQLEWLHFEGIEEFADSYGSETPAVTLPQGLFSPGVPPLRSLSVSTIEFDWHSVLILRTLRHLKVIRRRSNNTNLQAPLALSLSRFLDVLQELPRLESLELDNTAIPKYDPAAQHHPVTLPHLCHLHLSLASKNTSHLISHLCFPKTATVHLAMPPHSHQIPALLSEPTVLEAQQNFIVNTLEGMAVLGIATHLPQSLFYEASPEQSPCCIWAENTGSGDSPSVFPSSWDALEPKPPRLIVESPLGGPLLDGVFAAIDLRHLRFLSISEGPESPPRWTNTLRHAENLTTIYVSGTMAFGLGAALVGWTRPPSMDEGSANGPHDSSFPPSSWVGFAEAADDSLHFASDARARSGSDQGASDALSVRFPRLRVLRISRMDFRLARPMTPVERWRYHDFISDIMFHASGTPYGLDDEGLVRSLRLRAEHGGTRLDRLEFVDCQCFERERLVGLLGVVSELWWDGKRLTEADLPVQTLARV